CSPPSVTPCRTETGRVIVRVDQTPDLDSAASARHRDGEPAPPLVIVDDDDAALREAPAELILSAGPLEKDRSSLEAGGGWTRARPRPDGQQTYSRRVSPEAGSVASMGRACSRRLWRRRAVKYFGRSADFDALDHEIGRA